MRAGRAWWSGVLQEPLHLVLLRQCGGLSVCAQGTQKSTFMSLGGGQGAWGMSFQLTLLYAGVCIELVFTVAGDLEPTDAVEGAKDTNHMITPGGGLPHMSSGSSLKLPLSSPHRGSGSVLPQGFHERQLRVRATASPLFWIEENTPICAKRERENKLCSSHLRMIFSPQSYPGGPCHPHD